MKFDHNPFTLKYWFEDCPMLNPVYVQFAKSNKKYIFVFRDSRGEYMGEFYNEEPSENLFIDSHERGDVCGALFERNFDIVIDENNAESIIRGLILVDQEEYDEGGR